MLLSTLLSLGQGRYPQEQRFLPISIPLADARVSDAPGLNVLLLPSVDPWPSYNALLGLLALFFASALIGCAKLIRFVSLIT